MVTASIRLIFIVLFCYDSGKEILNVYWIYLRFNSFAVVQSLFCSTKNFNFISGCIYDVCWAWLFCSISFILFNIKRFFCFDKPHTFTLRPSRCVMDGSICIFFNFDRQIRIITLESMEKFTRSDWCNTITFDFIRISNS